MEIVIIFNITEIIDYLWQSKNTGLVLNTTMSEHASFEKDSEYYQHVNLQVRFRGGNKKTAVHDIDICMCF